MKKVMRPFIQKTYLLLFLFLCTAAVFHLKSQSKVQDLQKKLLAANLINYRLILESLDSLLGHLPKQEALTLAKQNLDIAKKTKSPQIICLADIYLKNMEGIYLKKKNMNLDKFLEMLNYAQLNQFQYESAFICRILALIYNLLEVPAKSLYYAEESVRIFKQIHLHQKAMLNYFDMGIAFYRMKEYKKAEKYLKQVVIENIPLGSARNKINAYNALGLIQFHLSKYKEALPYFETALNLAEADRDSAWIGIMKGNLGQAYGKLKKYELAQSLLAVDINYSLRFGQPTNAVVSLIYSGDHYLENNQTDKALASYREGLKLLKIYHRNKEQTQFINLYRGLAKCFRKFGQPEKAQACLDTVLIYQDSMIQSAYQREYEMVRKNVLMEKKEHQVENLSRENQNQKLVLTKHRFQQLLLGAFSAFVSSMLILAYFTNRQYKKTNTKLQSQNNIISHQNVIIEEKNKEIATQNEELHAQNGILTVQKEKNLHQKNVIEDQYNELKKVHEQLQHQKRALDEALIKIQDDEKLILQQNERLKNYNLDLEHDVLIRTKELSEKNKELIHYNNQLEQFSFITAHNLRAPVANLMGLCQILREDAPTHAETLSYVEKIAFTAELLDQIIRDLGKILEIRKNIQKSTEVIYLGILIEKILRLLEPQILEAQADIKLQFSDFQSIRSIPLYWESIFYNLISNALKYRDTSKPLEIHIGSRLEEHQLVIYVQDNGLGIDMDIYGDRLFGLYKRFHPNIEGKGMGLHLVKLQVEALGAKINAKSQLGQGTIFEIILPIEYADIHTTSNHNTKTSDPN